VRGMVLRQVGFMTIVGSGIGLVAAVWLGHLAQRCCSRCRDGIQQYSLARSSR
jgi:hypothetical protein